MFVLYISNMTVRRLSNYGPIRTDYCWSFIWELRDNQAVLF